MTVEWCDISQLFIYFAQAGSFLLLTFDLLLNRTERRKIVKPDKKAIPPPSHRESQRVVASKHPEKKEPFLSYFI